MIKKYLHPTLRTDFGILAALFIIIRVFRISELTTFGGDQGVDFASVAEILKGNPTLIGIKTSIAPFFQGPVYLYMLSPFFYFFNLHPIAGAYAALFYSFLSACVLYFSCLKFFGKKVAILLLIIYSVFGQFVIYGNTSLYQNFIPLFLYLALYLLILKKSRSIQYFSLGFILGLMLMLHYVSITFLAASLLLLVLQKEAVKKILSIMIGIFFGCLPIIIFELRHNFLNTNLFLEYLSSDTANSSGRGNIFTEWVAGSARFLGGGSKTIGILGLTLSFLGIHLGYKKGGYSKKLSVIGILLVSSITVFSLVFGTFGWEYPISYFLIAPIFIVFAVTNYKNIYLYSFFTILIIFNMFATFFRLTGDSGYDMPAGWNLKRIMNTAKIISEDSKQDGNFNVANTIVGGTRDYPVRYVVSYYYKTPVREVTDYESSNILYVISRSEEDLHKANVWEINVFAPFVIRNTWDIAPGISLFKLQREGKVAISVQPD